MINIIGNNISNSSNEKISDLEKLENIFQVGFKLGIPVRELYKMSSKNVKYLKGCIKS